METDISKIVNTVINGDCLQGMKSLPDGCVDLVVADPPYKRWNTEGGAKMRREYHSELDSLSSVITQEYLDEMVRVCKNPNIYLFDSKEMLPMYLNYAVNNGLSFDILTWHKTNPVPMCSNKYLSDTEYIVHLRKGAKIYGDYSSKKKWFVTSVNKKDKDLYGHPTCKPVSIIETLIYNSSLPGEIVLDPFIGSGTTAVACSRLKRKFIGYEINKKYYDKCCERIFNEKQNLFANELSDI